MQSLKPFIDKLKSGLRYIKEAFTFISGWWSVIVRMRLYRHFVSNWMNRNISAGQTIRNVKSWFKWINISCRTKIGTPYQMCFRQMKDLGKECEVMNLHHTLICSNLIKCSSTQVYTIFTGLICGSVKISLRAAYYTTTNILPRIQACRCTLRCQGIY